MYRVLHRAVALLPAAVLIAGLTGCSDKTAKEVAAMNRTNMHRLANLYAAHQNYKGGKGPSSEADFKEFIKKFDAEKLTMMGVNSAEVDKLFVSERDGKPFKVRYNVGGGRGSVDPVVFEAEGAEGKKQVGYTGGKVEDVDDATYQQLLAGKGGGTPKGDPKAAGRPGGGPPAGAQTAPKQ